MIDDSVLIKCAQCGQRFRIVAVNETVHVTCPKCAAQWDWSAAEPSRGNAHASSRTSAGTFWLALVLRPRLSYGAAAVVLAGGVVLGVWLARSVPMPFLEDDSQSFDLTNAFPVVQPVSRNDGSRYGSPPAGLAPAETFLPSNGVDFNPATPLGNNL